MLDSVSLANQPLSDERVLMGCKGAYSETPNEEYTESTTAPDNPCQLNARFCVACQSTIG